MATLRRHCQRKSSCPPFHFAAVTDGNLEGSGSGWEARLFLALCLQSERELEQWGSLIACEAAGSTAHYATVGRVAMILAALTRLI